MQSLIRGFVSFGNKFRYNVRAITNDGNNGAFTIKKHNEKKGKARLISFFLRKSFFTKKAKKVKTNKTNG